MSGLTHKTILFVEDDDADVELTRRAFGSYGFDASVQVAHDGLEAMEEMRRDPLPDLVLTDLKMPRLNGLELQALMRADARLAKIPVVFLTSSAEKGDREKALDQGAAGFLQKPMQLSQWEPIVAQLRGLLDTPRQ